MLSPLPRQWSYLFVSIAICAWLSPASAASEVKANAKAPAKITAPGAVVGGAVAPGAGLGAPALRTMAPLPVPSGARPAASLAPVRPSDPAPVPPRALPAPIPAAPAPARASAQAAEGASASEPGPAAGPEEDVPDSRLGRRVQRSAAYRQLRDSAPLRRAADAVRTRLADQPDAAKLRKYARAPRIEPGLVRSALQAARFDSDVPAYLRGLPPQALRPLLVRLYTDLLTGLRNNKYLRAHAAALAAEYDEIIMMDGDSFGSVDRALRLRFGNRVGGRMADEVVARLAQRAREAAQSAAQVEVIRKGGEEILVLAKAGEGRIAAEAVRQAGERFRAADLELGDILKEFARSRGVKGDASEIMRFILDQAVQDGQAKARAGGKAFDAAAARRQVGTVSLGMAGMRAAGVSAEQALEHSMRRADAALDQAKTAGGKNVVAVEEAPGEFRVLERRAAPVPARYAPEARADLAAEAFRREYQAAYRMLGPERSGPYLRDLYVDAMSGLQSRDYVQDHIEGILSNHDTLYRFEIDNFKAVNDHPRLGHDIGDAVLEGMGRLVREVRAQVIVEEGASPLTRSSDPEGMVAVRDFGKEFHVLGSDHAVRRFVEILAARTADGRELMAAAARAKFGAGRPDFEPTADMIESARAWVSDQARAAGKEPGRVGTITGAVVPIARRPGAPAEAAYDSAVQRASDIIDAIKSSRRSVSARRAGRLGTDVPEPRDALREQFLAFLPEAMRHGRISGPRALPEALGLFFAEHTDLDPEARAELEGQVLSDLRRPRLAPGLLESALAAYHPDSAVPRRDLRLSVLDRGLDPAGLERARAFHAAAESLADMYPGLFRAARPELRVAFMGGAGFRSGHLSEVRYSGRGLGLLLGARGGNAPARSLAYCMQYLLLGLAREAGVLDSEAAVREVRGPGRWNVFSGSARRAARASEASGRLDALFSALDADAAVYFNRLYRDSPEVARLQEERFRGLLGGVRARLAGMYPGLFEKR